MPVAKSVGLAGVAHAVGDAGDGDHQRGFDRFGHLFVEAAAAQQFSLQHMQRVHVAVIPHLILPFFALDADPAF